LNELCFYHFDLENHISKLDHVEFLEFVVLAHFMVEGFLHNCDFLSLRSGLRAKDGRYCLPGVCRKSRVGGRKRSRDGLSLHYSIAYQLLPGGSALVLEATTHLSI